MFFLKKHQRRGYLRPFYCDTLRPPLLSPPPPPPTPPPNPQPNPTHECTVCSLRSTRQSRAFVCLFPLVFLIAFFLDGIHGYSFIHLGPHTRTLPPPSPPLAASTAPGRFYCGEVSRRQRTKKKIPPVWRWPLLRNRLTYAAHACVYCLSCCYPHVILLQAASHRAGGTGMPRAS